MDLFSDDSNQSTIVQAHKKLEKLQMLKTSNTTNFIEPIKTNCFSENNLKKILQSMIQNPKVYDQCATNIDWIGKNFINALNEFVKIGSDADVEHEGRIAKLFVMAYRFMCEVEILITGDLHHELFEIKNQIDDHLDNFPLNEKSQILFANYKMPIYIFKKLINHPNVQGIRQYNTLIEEAETKKEEWRREIEERQIKVEEISNTLEKYKNAFNFVGLYDGFKELSDRKKKEKFWLFISLLAIGLLVVSPLIAEITYILLNQQSITEHRNALIFLVLPLVAIEILLIYFFRIILYNYKSVKEILIQLDLRRTLCQFIQNYSDYSKEIKEKDSSSLEKFENLIFSGLTPDMDKLPSTYDGIEQLTKLVKTIKS